MTDPTGSHRAAVDAFVTQVRGADLDSVRRLLLFGSVARGTQSPDSDADVLAVVEDEADQSAVEDRLRDIAYDVELEHGVVLSLVVLSDSEYRAGGPFLEHVRRDAELLHG
ncbi:MAG: nucleotidyltransferase domain-containing protein [Halobacteriales archaeon]